jgi:hypothetical protein
MEIGVNLGIVDTATSTAFVAAALLSVLIFPLTALALLRPIAPAPVEARAAYERSAS